MAEEKHTSVGTYILIALILGVITYVEFAIVEYDIAWLGGATTLWTLIILSVAKFLLVILYFMHLKGDDAMYQGFFTSGMIFALGTFTALAFLFTLPSNVSFVRGQFTPPVEAEHGEEHAGLAESTRTLIDSDGYSRELSQRLDAPPPRNQGFQVEVPQAGAADYAVQSDSTAGDGAAAGEPAGDGQEAAAAAEEPSEGAAAGEGFYSQEQADAGSEAYAANCAMCHGQDLEGAGGQPALAGDPFWASRGGETVQALYDYVSQQMPLTNPGGLDEDTYVDIVAHVLASNGLPAGAPLEPGSERLQTLVLSPDAAAQGDGGGDDAAAQDGDESAAAERQPSDEDAAGGADANGASWDQALGEETYTSNCASCHQPTGEGVPGAFPPLAGHVPTVAQAEGGRTYLVDVLLNGLQGPIDVDGQTYDGVMPAWGQLEDEALAAVLNHATFGFDGGAEAGGLEPFTADEVAERRDAGLSPQDVHATREDLALP